MSNEGFAIDLIEAEKAVNDSLPSAVAHLHKPISTLWAQEGFKGSGSFDAADRFEAAYGSWSEAQARRLKVACDVMDAYAAALRPHHRPLSPGRWADLMDNWRSDDDIAKAADHL